MLHPETLTSFISSYQSRGELTKHQEPSLVLLQSTCVITYYSTAWSNNLRWPWNYLFLVRDIQHHFHKAAATSGTPNHIDFLIVLPCLSLYTSVIPNDANISIRQHKHLSFSFLLSRIPAADNPCFTGITLQCNITKQYLKLSQLAFFYFDTFLFSLLD